ncbi:hypothetical protein [Pseudomonas sp. EA_5y_Pfl2_R50]|uniref:hypothetical protein n=1 Tax=Pseudomonas sp. EA_5y_Pfl2_R50 TaxID=3088691 RepID=UPI0030D86958
MAEVRINHRSGQIVILTTFSQEQIARDFVKWGANEVTAIGEYSVAGGSVVLNFAEISSIEIIN